MPHQHMGRAEIDSLAIHLTKARSWSFASSTYMSDLRGPKIFIMAESPTLCVIAGALARDEGSATVWCITCINRILFYASSLCRPYTDRVIILNIVEVNMQK